MESSNVMPSSFDPTAPRTSDESPTYSAAYLSELKAATPSSRPRQVAEESLSYDADMSLDPNFGTQVVDLTGRCHQCVCRRERDLNST